MHRGVEDSLFSNAMTNNAIASAGLKVLHVNLSKDAKATDLISTVDVDLLAISEPYFFTRDGIHVLQKQNRYKFFGAVNSYAILLCS